MIGEYAQHPNNARLDPSAQAGGMRWKGSDAEAVRGFDGEGRKGEGREIRDQVASVRTGGR